MKWVLFRWVLCNTIVLPSPHVVKIMRMGIMYMVSYGDLAYCVTVCTAVLYSEPRAVRP